MLTWNLYDDEIAFFPSEVESSITRFEVFQENRDNNALPFENWTGTSGTSLG